MTKLLHIDGSLYTPFAAIVDETQRKFQSESLSPHKNPILIYEYESGEIDTIAWPNPNTEHLRGALYGAREMGCIPNEPTVLLPNGREFKID